MELVYEKNLVEIWRVTPSVYFRKGSMTVRRQSNGAFIVSEDAVAAVDATTMEAAQEMMEESLHLFGQPLRYVFLTHGDGDHVSGLPFFLDQPITVFCSHLDVVAGFMEILLRTARRRLEPLTQAQVLALDEEKLKTMTAECLSGSDADAQTILQKAGNGAECELRKVIQSLVRKANADS